MYRLPAATIISKVDLPASRKTPVHPAGQSQHHCLKMSSLPSALFLAPLARTVGENHLCLIFRLFILLIDVPFLDEKTKNFQDAPSGRSQPAASRSSRKPPTSSPSTSSSPIVVSSWQLLRSCSRLPPADINQINYHTKTRFNLLRQYLHSSHKRR